jgi:IS30 family transposase
VNGETLSDTIKIFDTMTANHEKQKERQRQLEESPRTSRLPSQVNEMISMAWKLEDAARELQTALTLDKNPKKPAKDISKHTDVILRYLKYKGRKPQTPDMKAFEQLSGKALAAEILASAQRIDPQLRIVFQNEMADTVPIDFPLTLGPLEQEVLRVKWMVSRLK